MLRLHGPTGAIGLLHPWVGEYVHMIVYHHDRYGRVISTVTCNGRDVRERLVEHGYVIAAHGDQCEDVEAEARRAGCGMCGHATSIDPQSWRGWQEMEVDGKPGPASDSPGGQAWALSKQSA